jgi:starch synthase (maltosyl-transferring)
VIEDVYPELDCGRYPVKREVGDRLEVWADIFKEGHDVISAIVKHREEGNEAWSETPMRFFGNDRWTAAFDLTKNTRYEYAIVAWADSFETWRREAGKKVEAGQEVTLELVEGRSIVAAAYERSKDKRLARTLKTFDGVDYEGRLALLRSTEVADLIASHPDRLRSSTSETLLVTVDRERARYGAWYEMFHRSQGTVPGESATFADMEERLPELSELGFDVVYLVPRHRCRPWRSRQPVRHRERGGRAHGRSP